MYTVVSYLSYNFRPVKIPISFCVFVRLRFGPILKHFRSVHFFRLNPVLCFLSCNVYLWRDVFLFKVADQKSIALIRDLDEQAPIDIQVGKAISSLWEGESNFPRPPPLPSRKRLKFRFEIFTRLAQATALSGEMKCCPRWVLSLPSRVEFRTIDSKLRKEMFGRELVKTV